jgi:hypothetical protein
MSRQALVLLLVVLLFGVLVPWYRGFSFFQPWVIAAYGSMALLFVAPAAAEFWGGTPAPASPGAILVRILAIVGYGWGLSAAMLLAAVITLNLSHRTGRLLIPPLDLLASVLLFSLTASLVIAAVCSLLAQRFSAATVKALLRAFFLLVLLALAFGSRWLPDSWQIALSDHSTRRALTRMAWEASAICGVAACLLLALLLRTGARNGQMAAS